MTFKFTPGAPKPADRLSTLEQLKAKTEGLEITAAKSIGGNTLKIFTSGPMNYYIEGTPRVRAFLQSKGAIAI